VSRIESAFRRCREDERSALLTYIMAGDPTVAISGTLALECERGGADLLEIGVPCVDPVADGPEIRAASIRSLSAGTRPRDVLALVARLRRKSEIPILLITYADPVLAMGADSFASQCSEAGVDGVIVPDLSIEESGEVRSKLDAHGVEHVQLVAPSIPEDRVRAISRASRGFLYVVARSGATGTRSDIPPKLADRLRFLRRCTSLPLAVGFGISTTEQVRAVTRTGADGVAVGSAIVRTIRDDPRPESVEAFVRDLAVGAKRRTAGCGGTLGRA
jgi:tryptophan synthase alpha chain